jgi:RHS repeat-associated protein
MKKSALVVNPLMIVLLAVSFNQPNDFTIKTDYSSYLQTTTTTTINYEYDALYRLTEANYSTGDLYQYTYDAVGNRLTETTQSTVNSYQYDNANRLTSVNSVNYTFDDNGNLLSDGTNTYTYDSANRLIAISGQHSASYQYNGLGDRLTQNGVEYTLDLNSGLTQVLDDGENTYTYGLGRISQTNSETEYFLGDALGSVRQMTNNVGDITLAKSYEPYGSVSQSFGDGASIYAYTGEQQDASGLTYLRARYYDANIGRFTSRDSWSGNYNSPISLNRWLYANSNPILYTDPTGNYAYNGYNTHLQLGGNPIQYCKYLLALVVVDGPAPVGDTAALILCLALLGIAYIPTVTSPEQIQEVLDECKVTWEQLLENVEENPNPNQRPEPEASLQPLPPRIPVETPQPTPTNRIDLYRAVDEIELGVIETTGTYGYAPSGGGKYFAFTYAGVVKFATSPFNSKKKMTITNIDIPKDFLSKGYIFNDTGGAGPSIHFSDSVLPELYYVMSPIRILGSP